MKLFKKLNLYFVFVPLLVLFIVFSCEKTDDFIEDTNSGSITQGDPNKVTESLTFKNGTKIQGTMPTNTSGTALKMDRDTIGLTEGILPYIIFEKPAGTVLNTLYTQVEGSDTYFEAEFEEIDNDTLVYLNFEFDIAKFKSKTSLKANASSESVVFNLNISPIMNGSPVDVLTVPVIAQSKADNSGGCTIDEFLNGKDSQTYYWYYTYDKNLSGSDDNFTFIVPSKSRKYTQFLYGCCAGGVSSYSDVCLGLPTEGIAEAISKFSVGLATLKFYKNGSVSGSLINKRSQQPNASDTDYCNGVAAYNYNTASNRYTGTYTFNSANCTITIDNLIGETEPAYVNGVYVGEFPLPIHAGIGSRVIYSKISDNVLKEQHIDTETNDSLSVVQYYDVYKNF